MSEALWRDLEAALEPADADPVRFWIRDDDAVAVTPALQRLGDLLATVEASVLLAVIPAGATASLAAWTADRPFVVPCQHGYAHANHAIAPARACELGGERDDAAVLHDLAAGWVAMDTLFGAAWSPVLVPPWNRIRLSLLSQLMPLGYAALSTFAGAIPPARVTLPRLDCDLDIIDWRNGRRGRAEDDLCRRLVTLVTSAQVTGAPIGLLTHHLAHDETAWRVLDRLLPLLHGHPGAAFTSAAGLLGARPSLPD